MITIQDVLDKVSTYQSPEDADLVRKAYEYAESAHTGQTRLSGEPYLSHPLAVADTLADMRLDGPSVAAGLLHDTVEDTKATTEDICALFGADVAGIVEGVTKISVLSFDSKEERQAESIRKMILAMNEDLRVLFVKLADRLHNMRTLDFQKPEKRRAISVETMDIYAPLANRLGLHRIKLELEDLSFQYINPDEFSKISDWLNKNEADDSDFVDGIIDDLYYTLQKSGIKPIIKGRIKHVYSIHRKMQTLNVSLDEMHDIIAFRAIVSDIKDCYATLGLVHAIWRPVPGRFKDYISMPKGNMYQSLHTTVIGPNGKRMEIQIRSEEMDKLAEHGLASHWLYKEGGRVSSKEAKELTWLREMLDWQKVETDSREFLRSLRFDLFKYEIYVFTPQGTVKELPENATPVDFAYLIHSEVGDHCTGAKVNGKLVPLSSTLKSGDTVEIITDQNRNPSRDWLKFVKTAKARTRIQHYIRTVERQRSISLGREILEKQGRRLGVNFQKSLKEGAFESIAKELNFSSVDDLISTVGYARITPRKVLNFLLPKTGGTEVTEPHVTKTPTTKENSVHIQGVDDVLVRFAKCCSPVPGDSIVGYISHGRGLAVHTMECPTIQAMEPERLISVFWEGMEEGGKSSFAKIRIISQNTKGTLGRVATAIDSEGVNIDSGHLRSSVDGKSEMDFVVEVTDVVHLYRVLGKLRKVENVLEAFRVTSSND